MQIPHRALLNFLLSMSREPGLEPSDVLLAVTTLSFDIAGLELLLPLIVGARVEIATREEASDAELLKKRLAGASVMQATPATWRMLVDAGWEGGGLKVLCGGEALPSDLAAKLLPRVGSLWNMYGPTETTIWSATRRVAQEEEGASIAVGGAIANTQLYVLDRRLEPVPVGIPGELCIGGEGLARGYLDAPDLTAERFVPDPFQGEGERMYRTGDLVRWRPDGVIEFLGRIDFQVKVRGFRIELGEIEAALAAHPAVRQAVAGLRGDRLVAWIVSDSDADLREHLKGKLPEYMIPAAFVRLDAFPLTPSGKVDRKALPEPDLGAERRHAAPRGPVEEVIAGIWSELLGVDRVGSDDSFFELGGHSLLATRLVSRLRRAFGIELPVRQLFETPVLSRLAERVQAARQGGERIPPLRPMPRPAEVPLSFAQERLWFVEQLERDHSMYNLPAAVRLRGELRVDVLAACLREIVRRHEALRTRFVTVHGRPTQVIEDFLPSLPVVDLRGLPPAAAEAELQRRITEDEHRPYDLAAGPLVRATLLRLADEDAVVLFGMHHIISDRWSMGLLLREMAALYPAFATGEASPLPPLPVQYADYSLWQREWLRGEVLDGQLAYWTGKLAKLQPLDLPADRDAASGQIFRAGDLTFELAPPLAEGLQALARGQAASPFMVLLAAFQALLQRHSGQEDIAVGAPIAGRTRSEVEDLIGFFVNTLVLRTRVEPGLTFRELLERVRATTLEAYDHQDLPFSRVVDALRPSRRQGLGLVDVMFTMQNQPMPDMRLPGLEMSVLPISDEADLRINFALSLRVWESGGRMKGGLSYNTALFDRATAERWRDGFLTLLAAAVERPERPISEVPLPGVGERRQAAEPEPAPARPAAVTESVARQRAELTSRRDHLSAAKRELLEKRLRGVKAGAPAARPAQPAEPKALVRLQAGDGSRPPFFCVHAIGGSVFSYGELARALGPAQTFYGVQSPGLEGGPLLDDLPAMAAAYVAEIEAAAPHGPLPLGGWSFGGVVAFEMARQLRQRGREVPLVALLDSYAPAGVDLLAERSDADLLRPFLRDQAGLQGRGAEWLDEMPMAGEEAVARMLEQARAAGVLRTDLKSEKVERLLGVYKANLRALSSYQPQPYGGRIVLFRSEGAESRRPANGWEGLVGEPIETQSVSGDHYTMLAPPHVVQLAERLAVCIERALRAGAEAEAMA